MRSVVRKLVKVAKSCFCYNISTCVIMVVKSKTWPCYRQKNLAHTPIICCFVTSLKFSGLNQYLFFAYKSAI
jgi:hypothetical protein